MQPSPDQPGEVPISAMSAVWCKACQRICSSVRHVKAGLRKPSKLAANDGYPHVVINPTPGLYSHPGVVIVPLCNGQQSFHDEACAKPASLSSFVTTGYGILYNGDILMNCTYPGCGVLSTIDPDYCAFSHGGWWCTFCTLAHTAASILKRKTMMSLRSHTNADSRRVLSLLVSPAPLFSRLSPSNQLASILRRILDESEHREEIIRAEKVKEEDYWVQAQIAREEAEQVDDMAQLTRQMNGMALTGNGVASTGSTGGDDDEEDDDDDSDAGEEDASDDEAEGDTLSRDSDQECSDDDDDEHDGPVAVKRRYKQTARAINRQRAERKRHGVGAHQLGAARRLQAGIKRMKSAPNGNRRQTARAPNSKRR
jgi:hypothetical protein